MLALRITGTPHSTARSRARAACCRGPADLPNQPSLVMTTRQRLPASTDSRASHEKTGSKQVSPEKGKSPPGRATVIAWGRSPGIHSAWPTSRPDRKGR